MGIIIFFGTLVYN